MTGLVTRLRDPDLLETVHGANEIDVCAANCVADPFAIRLSTQSGTTRVPALMKWSRGRPRSCSSWTKELKDRAGRLIAHAPPGFVTDRAHLDHEREQFGYALYRERLARVAD